MLFTVEKPRLLWDNWLYFWEGKYFLYYLANKEGGPWDAFGLAMSDDAVHWTDLGDILSKDPGATWMGTGHVWKSPGFDDDGKFIINYSEWHGPEGTGQQYILFAESTDLVHWKKLAHRFGPDERWYNANNGGNSRWDTINPLPRPGGGLYGFWTATPKSHPAGIGFGESDDGVHWRALPAPEIDWGSNPIPSSIEIGGVEQFRGKYYNMIGAMFPNSIGGMFLLEATDPAGPYVAAARNYHLLTSRHGWTYYSRFFPGPDGLYVNHQSIEDLSRSGGARFVHVAPIKRAMLDNAGTFFLGYWERTDGLKGEKIALKPGPAIECGEYRARALNPAVDPHTGLVVEGVVPVPATDAERVGMYFEVKIQRIDDHVWFAVLVGRGGRASIGILDPMDGTFEELDTTDRAYEFGQSATLRLLVRGGLVEVYLADVLLQSATMPLPPTGKVGLVTRTHGAIGDPLPGRFTAWTMEKNYH
ncbi:MAG: hypothetical protein JW839_08245 [Candidatus Lokiarchaeota archaeon]|nr:hypothetical protein [Candidatus Lokiarchaeota archaeon]